MRRGLVVNLLRRRDRWRWFVETNRLWLALDRVHGFDGRRPLLDPDPQSRALYDRLVERGWYDGVIQGWWRLGEIGALLSHARAWKTIAAASDPFAFVFEDDATVTRAGVRRVAGLMTRQPVDVVFVGWAPFYDETVEVPGVPYARALAPGVKYASYHNPGAFAYALSDRAAAALFGHLDRRTAVPADHFIMSAAERCGLRVWFINPPGATAVINAPDSDIRSAQTSTQRTLVSPTNHVYPSRAAAHGRRHGRAARGRR